MDYQTEKDLHRIRAAAVRVTGDESLQNCCSCVAIAVKAMIGGEVIEGKVKRTRHFWNRLNCGTEIDLTSSQFKGNGWNPLGKGNVVPLPSLIPIDALVFLCHLQEQLASDR